MLKFVGALFLDHYAASRTGMSGSKKIAEYSYATTPSILFERGRRNVKVAFSHKSVALDFY